MNPSRPDPGRKGKTNINFIFTLFYDASKGFMKALKSLHKTFSNTTKKYENKNLG